MTDTKNKTINRFSLKSAIKKISLAAYPCLLLFIAVYVCLNAKTYVPVTLDGITLWALSVVPPLFPFFVLSAMIAESGFPQRISRTLSPITRILYNADGVAAYLRITSLISGYPVGVKAIADLKESGIIDEKEAENYATFSSTSGPNFIMGFVGVKFGGYGLTLFLIHAISSLLTGVFFSLFTRQNKRKKSKTHGFPILTNRKDFGEIVSSSVMQILSVGGFVVVFFLFSRILIDAGILKPLEFLLSGLLGKSAANGLITGLIECTTGCNILSREVTPLSLSLASAIISFGGLSVIFQSRFFLKKCGAGFTKFFFAKIFQSVISFLISLVAFNIMI